MRVGRLLFAVLAALALTATARATTVLPLDIEGLTARSDRVVRARVLSRESREAGDPPRLHTFTTLEVLDDLAGSGPARVVLRQLGGTRGGAVERIDGDAELVPGEEVVVFLRANPHGAPVMHLVGLGQGAWRIERTDAGATATRALAGLAFESPGPRTRSRTAPRARLDLDELERRVRAAAR